MNFEKSTREIRRADVKNSGPSETVVEAIADVEETEPIDIPPLYESIDPDHLDALHQRLDDVEVRFVHAGYLVGIEGTGTVVLRAQA